MKKLRNMKALVAVAVSLMTFLVYLPSLGNTFLSWDDGIYVTENSATQKLDRAFFRWAFTAFHAANWHPLTWISHALDYAVWGLNPLGHHLTNNILHAVNTFLVVLLVVKLMEACKPASLQAGKLTSSHYSPLIVAGVTGLLFGIHPIHVESVAWVSERKDLLCALFYLLSVMAYMKYAARLSQRAESKEQRAYISMPYAPGPLLSALCFFILALMSKPMAVSLPVVLLLLDWYPFGRIRSVKTFLSALTEKIPFIAFSLVSSVLTILAQKSGGAMGMMEIVPLSSRLLVAAHSLVAYLGKMIVPVKLLPFYPYPKSISLFSLEFFPALVLAIGITAVCIVRAKKQKIWLALWGYYVVTLVPVLGIVQVGTQAMADRYSYLPGLGPSLLTGLLTAWAYEKVNTLRKGERVVSLLSATAVLLMVASMIYLTIRQIEIWKNDLSMWDHIIYKEPEGVSMAYYNRCKLRQEMHQLDKALEDCNKAIALNRFSDEAYNVRGNVLEQLGQFDSALADYKTAIALNPLSFGAHYNRGILLNKLGKPDRALEDYTRAIILNPLYYEAYVNRGNVLAMMGQGDGAIADYDKAISVNPYRFEAYMNRAIFFLKMGQRERGISDLTTACNSGSKKACDALQVLLYPTGATEDGNYR